MSRLSWYDNFNSVWSSNKYAQDPRNSPSQEQFDNLKTGFGLLQDALNEFSDESPIEQNRATITTVVDSDYIVLPIDYKSTVRNKATLSKLYRGLNPYLTKPGYSNLNFANTSPYSGNNYTEFSSNYSKRLRPPTNQHLPINIKNQKIDGVYRPTWVLYNAATTVYSYELLYDANHTIKNAVAKLTLVELPEEGDILTISSNTIPETELTFVEATPTANEILIGDDLTETFANIKEKLICDLDLNEDGLSDFLLISNKGNELTLTSFDGNDFSLTASNTDSIVIIYTESVNTIDKDNEFLGLLKVYALESLTSQQLIQGVKIKDCRDEADRLRTRIVNSLRSIVRSTQPLY